MKTRRFMVLQLVLAVVAGRYAWGTVLDDYIKKADDTYSYSVAKTIEGEGGTIYVLDLKSQSWRSEKEVDRTVWQHWLTVIVPDEVSSDKALLWINGGANGRGAPNGPDSMVVDIARKTKSVVADLKTVPNQPLTFAGDGKARYEDEIIAYTFHKFVTTKDGTWPLLLPMVKSAVRAMDAVQDQVSKATGGKSKINGFVVSGGSKRGWTTWLTAAVDKRVAAIAPAVIDVLNMNVQMKHHHAAYGFYSTAIQDYEDMNIFARMDTPEGKALTDFVDPYVYRERLTMPKFLINGSGDQFFLLDSSRLYFQDLKGEKYLRYVPNADHSLRGSDAVESLLVFYASVLRGAERPRFGWKIEEDGTIRVRTRTRPVKVNLWQAENPKARDFRLETIGKVWTSSELKAESEGNYTASLAAPEKGWRAFFVEMIYESGLEIPYKFTTSVSVVPDRLPFAGKE